MPGWSHTFTAVKGKGGLSFGPARPFFDRVVSSIPDGVQVRVRLDEHQDKRTHAQNRGLWGPIYDQAIEVICAHEGYRRDEWHKYKPLIHEGLCGKYGDYDICPVTKKEIRRFRTSKATKQEMADYMNWIGQLIAEDYGVAIKMPGEAA